MIEFGVLCLLLHKQPILVKRGNVRVDYALLNTILIDIVYVIAARHRKRWAPPPHLSTCQDVIVPAAEFPKHCIFITNKWHNWHTNFYHFADSWKAMM